MERWLNITVVRDIILGNRELRNWDLRNRDLRNREFVTRDGHDQQGFFFPARISSVSLFFVRFGGRFRCDFLVRVRFGVRFRVRFHLRFL